MSENNGSMGKSMGAVIAGIVAIFVLSLGTDFVLHGLHVFPPWGEPVSSGPLLLATAYRIVYAVVGGYIVARLAPRRAMRHAMIYGAVGVVLSTVGAVATWNGGPAFGPHWYPIALIVISLPSAWLGGRLGGKRSAGASASGG